MNKRETRLFAIVSTTLVALLFVGLTVDSHRQFGTLTHADQITPAVSHGKDVWHKYNCVNCHTLFGEGAYYAPDLTKIAQLRGEQYIKAYLHDPSKFYDEQKHRRLMPKQNLSDDEIADVYAFLSWVSKVDNNGWPPRPILVSGASIPGTDLSGAQQANTAVAAQSTAGQEPPGARPVKPENDPIALGQALFRATPPGCFACHSVAPGVNLTGPSLSGVAARAQQIVTAPGYHGAAKDAAGYIRESIVHPNAYLVPGPAYSANGQSFMPMTFGKDLGPDQIDQIVAYLASLK